MPLLELSRTRLRSLRKADAKRQQKGQPSSFDVFVFLSRAAAVKSLDEVLEGLGAFTRRRSC